MACDACPMHWMRLEPLLDAVLVRTQLRLLVVPLAWQFDHIHDRSTLRHSNVAKGDPNSGKVCIKYLIMGQKCPILSKFLKISVMACDVRFFYWMTLYKSFCFNPKFRLKTVWFYT